jgi:hypothetical protein
MIAESKHITEVNNHNRHVSNSVQKMPDSVYF